jgi:hypothetical protein
MGKEESEAVVFWMAIYTAAIFAGNDTSLAKVKADTAMKDLVAKIAEVGALS